MQTPVPQFNEIDRHYKAVVARDRRFDGRFFTAVKTTGIYCRPICPARTPLKKNVSFFPTAAAAEAAGFRPCLRCRPDTAPGMPAWSGTSATVARALRLLASETSCAHAGEDDKKFFARLSERLGIGERQLRRLFVQHLGAPPSALRQLMRLDFARQLIDHTQLPVGEAAFAAGFTSIRRFNAAFKARFLRSPSELRRKHNIAPKKTPNAADGSAIYSLRLPFRPPYDFASLLQFLRDRAIPGVEACSENSYARTFVIGGKSGWLEVRRDGDALTVKVATDHPAHLMEILARVKRLFDTEADPLAASDHLKRVPAFAPLVRKYPGLRVPGAFDGFELAVRAVLGQQVSVAGARTLASRLAADFGEKMAFPGQAALTRAFPDAKTLLAAPFDRVALPGGRKQALKLLAAAAANEQLSLAPGADTAEVTAQLTAIAGIGPWTAGYIAMRALGDPDAYPVNDLILNRGATIGEDCSPWRAYAALLAWKAAAAAPKHPTKQKIARRQAS